MDPRTFGAVNRGLKIPNNAGRYEGRSSHLARHARDIWREDALRAFARA
jgi:hypothetical protein